MHGVISWGEVVRQASHSSILRSLVGLDESDGVRLPHKGEVVIGGGAVVQLQLHLLLLIEILHLNLQLY